MRLGKHGVPALPAPEGRAARAELLEARLLMFSSGSDGTIHENITGQGLSLDPSITVLHENANSFIRDDVLGQIISSNAYQDATDQNELTPSLHFDSSYFVEGAANIDGHYSRALQDLNPAAFTSVAAAQEFGALLHTAQDFYSHSNWVESGETGLVEGGLGTWGGNNAFAPYSIRGDAILLEGNPPASFKLARPSYDPHNPRLVQVTYQTHVYKGILTGSYTPPGALPTHTPSKFNITHDDLNKDYGPPDNTVWPARPGFAPARALAVQQTTHEFQRLGAMVASKYGTAGLNALLSGWVKSDGASQAAARKLLGLPATTPAAVTGLTLLNADTGQPIAGYNPLPAGATIDLAALPTRHLNVQAITNPAAVGSVKFGLDGNASYQIDSSAPYQLNAPGGPSWTPSVGSHTVTATPFTLANAGGTAGTSLSVTFRVVDSSAAGTMRVLAATGDAYVQDGSTAASNFGAASSLLVKVSPNAGFSRESLLKFDISSVTGTTGTVKLRLFGGLQDTRQTNIVTDVYGTSAGWQESSVTWNTRPAPTTAKLASQTILDTTGRWYEWDVTAFVQSERAAGRTTVAFLLRNPLTGLPYTWFNSREASANGPQLDFAGG